MISIILDIGTAISMPNIPNNSPKKAIENNTISYRCLGSNETINMEVEKFVDYIIDVINSKK